MKRIVIAFSLLLTCGMASAEDGPQKQVRVSVQYIELPHTVLTELLAGGETDGAKLHDKAFALTKDGKAKMVETGMIVCRSGEKATAELIREEIYPTAAIQPPPIPSSIGDSVPSLLEEEHYSLKHRAFFAFDTRNTGTTLEVEATVLTDGHSVELRFVPELVSRIRLETMAEYRDKWGDGSIRMPIYEAWRTHTSLKVRAGKFALVSVITPKPRQAAPFEDSRILLFVRADVIDADR